MKEYTFFIVNMALLIGLISGASYLQSKAVVATEHTQPSSAVTLPLDIGSNMVSVPEASGGWQVATTTAAAVPTVVPVSNSPAKVSEPVTPSPVVKPRIKPSVYNEESDD
jgi:hypothetical protein